MPIRNLYSPTKTLVDELINHHSPLLNAVNDHQLLDFINLLKNKDFNKLDDSELCKVKQDMEKDFIKNQIPVTDPKFEYDVRVLNTESINNEWDDSEVIEEDFGDISIDDLLHDL